MAGEGMITLKLKKGDQEKLQRALEAQLKNVNMNTPVVLAQAGHKGASYCRKAAPVDTSRLRASIGIPTKGGIFQIGKSGISGSATGVMFGTAVEYAIDVEQGTKPHTIEVGKKGFLAWKDKKTKEWIYTKKPVDHPGTKGSHFMLRGVTEAIPDMVNILTGVMR